MERQEAKAIMRQYKEYLNERLQHETDPLFNRFKAQNDIRAFNYVIEFLDRKTADDLTEKEINNLMSDLQKGDDLTEKESETGCTDKKCLFYLNPDYTRCKECEEKRKAGIMTPVEIARLVAGEYDKHDTEQDKVTQWIKDNADFIKEMARMLEDGRIQG